MLVNKNHFNNFNSLKFVQYIYVVFKVNRNNEIAESQCLMMHGLNRSCLNKVKK